MLIDQNCEEWAVVLKKKEWKIIYDFSRLSEVIYNFNIQSAVDNLNPDGEQEDY